MAREKIEHYVRDPLKSPFGKVYLCPKTEQIINCAIGLKHPIDLEALKKAFSNSIILKHPRFSSLMVKDQNGIERWERVQVNIDDHIVVKQPNTAKTRLGDAEVEAEINAYLADISVATPLNENKPLWEVRVLMGLKCVVLRVHHALGDGVSLMSMLNACFGKKKDDIINTSNNSEKKSWRVKNVWGLINSLRLTLVFGLRYLWVKDKQSVISGGDGVQIWPKTSVTAKFKLQDFKRVKKAIPSATVNDVLLGALSYGLSKYMEIKSPQAAPRGLDITVIVMVNLRKDTGLQEMSTLMGRTSAKSNSSFWGNKTGLVLQPVYCSNGLHPFEHVKIMKAVMDQKKKSYEAHLAYIFLKTLTFFTPKVASWCVYRVLSNTTLVVSNIVGPSEEIIIGHNPVTFLRVNVSGVPHAMSMHLVSYNGNADLQVTVAKDIIHDPEFLANCIQESVDQMSLAEE